MFFVKGGKLLNRIAPTPSRFLLDSHGDIYAIISNPRLSVIHSVTARADLVCQANSTAVTHRNYTLVPITAKAEFSSTIIIASTGLYNGDIFAPIVAQDGDIFKYRSSKFHHFVVYDRHLLTRSKSAHSVTAVGCSFASGTAVLSNITYNSIGITAKCDLVLDSRCSSDIFDGIGEQETYGLRFIDGRIYGCTTDYRKPINFLDGLVYQYRFIGSKAICAATASASLVTNGISVLSALAYNSKIGITASSELVFTEECLSFVLDGVDPDRICKPTFLDGQVYRHSSSYRLPFNFSDGSLYRHHFAELKAIHAATAKAELKANGSAVLSNLIYNAYLPATSLALIRSNASATSTIFIGWSIPLAVDKHGDVFKHLPGIHPNKAFDDGLHYNVLISRPYRSHTVSASIVLVFNVTRAEAYAGPVQSGASCSATAELISTSTASANIHNSFYDLLPIPYFKDGQLFRHRTGSPQAKHSIYIDKGVIYRVPWQASTLPVNIVEITAAPVAIITSGTVDCRTELHSLNPSSARADLISSGSATIIHGHTLSVTASANLISYGNTSADLHEIFPCTARADIVTSGQTNAIVAFPVPVSAQANLVFNSTAMASNIYPILANGNSSTEGTTHAIIAKVAVAIGKLISDGPVAELCFKGFIKVHAHCNLLANGAASIKSKWNGIASYPIELIGVNKTNQVYSCLASTSFTSDGLSANSNYKFKQEVYLDLELIGSSTSIVVKRVSISASANFTYSANGYISQYHVLAPTARGDFFTKMVARAARKTNITGKAILKFAASSGKANVNWNAKSSANITTDGSAWSPPFNVKKSTARAGFTFNADGDCDKKFFLYTQGILNTLRWNQVANIDHYDLYRSDWPGATYYKIAEVPQSPSPSYEVPINIIPRNLVATSAAIGARLSWQEPEFTGSPMTFKINPITPEGVSLLVPTNDLAWMEDDLPAGAYWTDQTGMTLSTYRRHGSTSIQVTAENGYVEPRFQGATAGITDANIIVWVNIKKGEIPDCIWLSLYDDNDWEHRIYWGDNRCPFGENGTESRRYAESLPNPGTWAPLIFHTKEVNIFSVKGIGFGVAKQNGKATVYFDSIYYTSQPVKKLPLPHTCLRSEDTYAIYRNGKFVAFTNDTTFYDQKAIDIYGYTTKGTGPVYRIELIDLEDKVQISWGVPDSRGTDYHYKLSCFDSNGVESDFLEALVHVTTSYSKVSITISSPSTPEYTVESTGFSYILENVKHGETYRFVLSAYDDLGSVVATTTIYYTVPWGSVLDEFVLDESILA